MLSLPKPYELGAPQKFKEWRDGQDDLFEQMLIATTRFLVLDAPTGIGKSLLNVVYATAQSMRELYLTADLGLQNQVGKEFAPIGMTDARGMGNYPCLILPPKAANTCDKGPCLDGGACDIRFKGCLYYDALREARSADLTLSNYAMHFTLARNSERLGKRDVLVADEAHEIAETLSTFMRVELKADEVLAAGWPRNSAATDVSGWRSWAASELPAVTEELADETPGTEGHRKLKRLKQDLERLRNILPEERWVWQFTKSGATIEPVWAAPYAEQVLFQGIPKVILSSATLRPQSLKYLGLVPGDYSIVSALSPFPAVRRPIIHIKTGARLKWGMDAFTLRKWLDAIDSIIEQRLDRKGIIHAVSYERAKMLKEMSRFRHLMVVPHSRNTREVVERFKAASPPSILVSPSVDTGYDFPYDTARYQIIAKMPFAPIEQNPILQIRQSEDKDYGDYLVATKLVQMAGRVVRAVDDMGETFIVDDHAEWFHLRRAGFFPSWYMEAYRTVKSVPPPPKVFA